MPGWGSAGAWAIGGGHARWLAIVIAIVALGNAVGWYVLAGNDSDDGALLGSRGDERQKLVGQKARALAGVVAMIAAYTGLLIALAVKRSDAWQFAALFAVTGFAYLLVCLPMVPVSPMRRTTPTPGTGSAPH